MECERASAGKAAKRPSAAWQKWWKRNRASALLLGIACSGERVAVDDSVLEAQTLQLARADSALQDSALTAGLSQLQQVADTATSSVLAAPALLRLGLLKLRLFPNEAADSFVARRPGDFAYDEISASHLYRGREFDVLLERYPTSVLADDAAYARTFLARGGECEGFTDCYAAVATRELGAFLQKYPDSRHAAAAVQRSAAELRSVFAVQSDRQQFNPSDLTEATQFHDPAAVQRVIEDYEITVRQLRRDVAAPAFYLLADLWERYRRVDLARDLYERLLIQPGVVPVDSVRVKLSRLR